MARETNKLSAKRVSDIKQKGRYSDGGGLYLRVSPTLSKSWVFRWVRDGTATEIGLGPFPVVSLSEARVEAFECRRMVFQGKNPRLERNREQQGKRSFGEVADEYLLEMGSRWNSEKTIWQWHKTLQDFCKPVRQLPINEIDTEDILRLLKPIWLETPETAAKARMRLEAVLDYAKAKGWREGDNPARWRGHLSNILPPRQRLSKGHHPAMAYQDVPAFVERLKSQGAISAKALAFLILTAARTSEILNTRWEEIDFENKLWVIPAERMKAKREHRVPLTDAAIAILNPLHEARISDYVFPSTNPRKPMSNMAMQMLMKRMKVKDATPHGFRSSFRDWAGDTTSHPREIAEAALAHKVGDSVELAYRRGDALEKRRRLMESWAAYCRQSGSSEVVSLHG